MDAFLKDAGSEGDTSAGSRNTMNWIRWSSGNPCFGWTSCGPCATGVMYCQNTGGMELGRLRYLKIPDGAVRHMQADSVFHPFWGAVADTRTA